MNYTYLLKCSDGSFYCGWTNDLKKRLAAHNAGTGAKYTKGRLPVVLAYYETFDTKEEAMSREWHIKKLTRKEKEGLTARFEESAERQAEAAGRSGAGNTCTEAATAGSHVPFYFISGSMCAGSDN